MSTSQRLEISLRTAGGRGDGRPERRPTSARGSDVSGAELFSEERSAEVVAASFAGTPDARLRRVMTSLVEHLHAFVKDVELTEAEWGFAIDFLTRTGQMSNEVRQ